MHHEGQHPPTHQTLNKSSQHQISMHGSHSKPLKLRFFVSLVLTIPLLLLSESIQTWFNFNLVIPYQNYILLVLAAVIYVYGGWPFLTGVVQEVQARKPGMMTLISTGISVAFFFSAATVFVPVGGDFFWELATLIDVMLLGHWLEARSVLGASRSLEELVKVIPANAHVVRSEGITEVAVSQLAVGDVVLVRPGEKIPSDGVVVEGESSVDEALVTGESNPVNRKTNDKVIGGSVNGEGALKIKVQKTGEQTYLSQVIKLVKQAQESKSKTQDLANRAAALLFYVAVLMGALTFAVWASLGNVQFALTRSVTVLVIACPHALGLAIPLVVALSTTITAKRGVLIRDRKAFEEAKDVSAVVFDKTGTLTKGQIGVAGIVHYVSEEKFLGFSAAVEQNSEHAIAKAIVKYAMEKGAAIPKSRGFQAIIGKGAKADVNGNQIYVGGPQLLEQLKISITDPKVAEFQNSGKTVVFTILEGKLVGAFALSDQVREESKLAVQELKAKGIRVYMLTGDSKTVAKAVADELGIDGYFAEVLPDQKAQQIKSLQNQGLKVAMVGDGINDAPALATAEVGIAIGAGTDVAIESADVILVKNNPMDVARVIGFSRRTYSKMLQNLWWAAGYNVFALPLAAGVFAGFGIVVDPAVGAIFMSLSTVLVAINSQTIRRQKNI